MAGRRRKIDKIIDDLTQSQVAELYRLLEAGDALKIAKWLLELGYPIEVRAIANWMIGVRGEGTGVRALPPNSSLTPHPSPLSKADAINQMIEDYDGVKTFETLSTVQGLGLNIAIDIAEKCKSGEDIPVTVIRALGLLPGFLRECRSAATQKEEMRFIKDKKALELAGAQRMADILLNTFKDTLYFEGVAEAIKGATLQIEGEV